MDSSKISEWLQVVGLFGVIASLIFVGLQMKQDREIALSQIYQARSDTTVETMNGVAGNPIILSAIAKLRRDGFDSLSNEEQIAVTFQEMSRLHNYEAIHYQFQNGFIDDEHWSTVRTKIKNSFKASRTRATYELTRDEWRASFAILLDEVIAEIEMEANQ